MYVSKIKSEIRRTPAHFNGKLEFGSINTRVALVLPYGVQIDTIFADAQS